MGEKEKPRENPKFTMKRVLHKNVFISIAALSFDGVAELTAVNHSSVCA